MKKTTTTKSLALFFKGSNQPGRKRYFWGGTLGAIAATLIADILPAMVVARAFNTLQYSADNNLPLRLDAFTGYIWVYVGLILASIVMWRAQVWMVWKYEIVTIRDFAIRIFDHLQRLDATFHANRFGGALVSQTNKFLSAYERTMDEFTWSVVTGVTAYIASFIVLLFNSPLYAVIFLALSSLFLWQAIRRNKKTMPFDRALAASESERTAKLADMITNVSAVSAFASEAYEKQLFTKHADQTTKHYWTLLYKAMVNDTVNHSITSLISVSAFVSGIVAITVFNSPAGALFLTVSYTMQMGRRLWESSRVMRNLNRSFGDATDMTEILDIQPTVKDPINPEPFAIERGAIELKNVVFTHSESNDALFEDFNLSIKQGEKIGLVGHSGSGKTSLTKLLLRFSDIDEGSIEIDGQDIRNITQQDLRSNIAYVPQEPLLFHRTLAENIAYGKTNATQKDIERVAKMAHAHDFISTLGEGYSTLVGERGVKLSGGQRQRVAIARAMLKDAPILVLDEATSALDSESEALIQDALWKLMQNRTAIVIAHRLSTIQKMDRIVVMEEGKIVEEGSHKDLLKKNGTYAKLWNHQSGGFIEE